MRPFAAHNETAQLQQMETIFACLPDGVIACDQNGKILRLNAAALKLFEVSSEDQCRGRDCHTFVERYVLQSEQQRPVALERWPEKPGSEEEAIFHPSEAMFLLRVPSGRKIAVKQSCSPVLDSQKQVRGKIFLFHKLSQRDQQALHLQRVHEAVLNLTEAIAHLPEHFPEQDLVMLRHVSPLFSPPQVFIAQQLADVIRHVLNCHQVMLKAVEGPAEYLHYVAGSGFTAEQERSERAKGALCMLSEAFDAEPVARFHAHQEIILPGDRVSFPASLGDLSSEKVLFLPLVLKQRLAGLLCVFKTGRESGYTPEEIELVKAAATQAVLVMEYLRGLHEKTEARIKESMLQEVHRLSNDFLILANHELRTPLTGILGNLQLAQRRLTALNRHIAAAQKSNHISEYLEQAQQPLASASAAAWLQQRIINDIVDDARIQTNQLELHVQRCDLLVLLKTAVIEQQRLAPEHPILVEVRPAAQTVPVLVDTERITQVFTAYLTNALTSSPMKAPVTVQMTIEEGITRVSVHNEGPGIPLEEQKRLWERSYRSKGSAVQQELDLSLGFRLYLCRAFIEQHGGHVGVQSTPSNGATFWFTLSLAPCA